MKVEPYLYFYGRCDEAIAFYAKAIGAKKGMLIRFKDAPGPVGVGPEMADKVMHASLTVGSHQLLMSDGECTKKADFQSFSLALTLPDEAAADAAFNGLCDGGTVRMRIGKTFFAARFGMVVDRFGVLWNVMTE